MCLFFIGFFFSSRRRHTRCALVTGVQTCALPIADMLRSERYAGLFRVDRAAHALEHDRFLAEQIGDELGAVVIVDAEYLQDPGVRQEGAGAALVARAERSEEHTSELQSPMRNPYSVFWLQKHNPKTKHTRT